MPLAFWLLASFGAAYIVGHSRISLWPRQWFALKVSERPLEFIECPACFGTWLGFLGGSIWPLELTGGLLQASTFSGAVPLTKLALAGALLVGCATAGSNYLLSRLVGLVRPEEPDYPEALDKSTDLDLPLIIDQPITLNVSGFTPEEHVERAMPDYGDEEELGEEEDDGSEARHFRITNKETGSLAYIAAFHIDTVHQYYPPERFNIFEELPR
jgi:hypothetical protein